MLHHLAAVRPVCERIIAVCVRAATFKRGAMNEGLDFIGDIHGHADALEALLRRLGYVEDNGCYRHATR